MESIKEKRRNRTTKITAMVIALLIHAAVVAAIWYASGGDVDTANEQVETKELTYEGTYTYENMRRV